MNKRLPLLAVMVLLALVLFAPVASVLLLGSGIIAGVIGLRRNS